MIDITKPLELEDGTPVELINILNYDSGVNVRVPKRLAGRFECTGRTFSLITGKHCYNELPNLRNKIMKLVDVNKPVTVGGKEAKIIHVFDNGNLAVVVDGWAEVQNYNQYGQANGEGAIILVNTVQITERWVNVYPTLGNCYAYNTKSDADIYRSVVNHNFQVKQTLHDGVVVSTEVVA